MWLACAGAGYVTLWFGQSGKGGVMRHPTKHLRLFLASLAAAGWLAVLAGPAVHAGQHNAAPGLARAIAAQELYTADLLAIRGVVGTAVGLGANGDPVVKIYTVRDGVAGLPSTLDGVGVRIQVTGAFFALHHFCGHDGGPPGSAPFPCDGDPPPDEGGGDVDPTAWFARPVPIGVSSGTTESITVSGLFVSCSGGTLGARLTHGTNVYALSNNHIYAEEGTAVIGAAGKIVQPGPNDNDPVCGDGSLDDPTDSIGSLAAFAPIEFDVINEDGTLNVSPTDNLADAAIASTTTALVGNTTPAGGYGTPAVDALLCDDNTCANLLPVSGPLISVQKYGRTTGLTKGTITAVNGTFLVGYNAGIAQFIHQIEVTSSKGPIIKGGDSGSLLVTDPDNDPVGLIFAGPRSGKTALVNPIHLVLSELGLPNTVDFQ